MEETGIEKLNGKQLGSKEFNSGIRDVIKFSVLPIFFIGILK